MATETTTTELEHIFICICPHYWGKGSTVEEAKKQAKREGGSLQSYIVYLLPPVATSGWVDQMGYLRWEFEGDVQGQPTVVAKRGVK